MNILQVNIPNKLQKVFWFGLATRLIAICFGAKATDFEFYRLPIAECIASGSWLYCDCVYNHTPFYPYLSAFMFLLAGGNEFLQLFLINFPLAVGDSIIVLVLFVLLVKLKKEEIAYKAALIYAFNPISLIEVGISHWDGFTSMFLILALISIQDGKTKMAGIWAGLGVLLKQFPIVILPIYFLKEKKFGSTIILSLILGAVVLAAFSPFLLNCPETFFQGLTGHPLWVGAASEKVGIGTIKNVFEHLGVGSPKFVWLILFLLLLVVPSLKTNRNNYIYFAGIMLVTLAFFTFVTHRQLIVWCLPFLIMLTLERKTYAPFYLLFVGYAIRILKPDWYFGFVHLGVGVWFYIAFYRELVARRFTKTPD